MAYLNQILGCVYLSIISLCILLAFNNNSMGEDVVEVSKLSQNVGGPSLKFLYCYSCGYKKMYDQYVGIINAKYPLLHVDGGNYDPPGIQMFLARILGMAKMFVIFCVLWRVNVFQYLNMPCPAWWTWCLENKIYACMMIFFLCNLVEGQLIQSGAFEISLNDIPVWSKLETGRIPQPAELFNIIDTHINFAPDNTFEVKNGFAK